MKDVLKKVWHFIWVDGSILSWIVNAALAFLLVKFIIYPLLGMVLGTSYPVVAVISGSMEHNGLGFDAWWESNKGWYLQNDISKEELDESIFRNGFNKGDIILLLGAKPDDIDSLDVIVYNSDNYKYPIIHRIVTKENKGLEYIFTTKGDNNPGPDPAAISPGRILGKAVFRIPLLGWVKIWFSELIGGMA